MKKHWSIVALVALAALVISACDGETGADSGENVTFELVAKSSTLNIGDGVTFEGFTFNDTMPGPQGVVQQGDTVEIIVHNEDSVTHGLSMHAVDGQTSNFLGNIQPGETATLEFEAEDPGVFMYHCAPGGHGIMAHTMGGQHGMFVVMPDEEYQMEQELGREPDIEIFMVQHEVYRDGREFFDGTAQYVMFNGETFRYVRDPIKANPDDYIRFYFLNVGPNLTSTFHAVGGVWDYIYYGGVPANKMEGTQSVVAGPTDSYVIEWQVPEEGPFTLVSHAFGTQAIKGAVGIIDSSHDHERDEVIRSEGLDSDPIADPKRHVSPFGLGSEDLDYPVRWREGDRKVIEMVGNSFVPKRVEVPVGSEVTFLNEDVFDMLEGELTGKHDAVVVEADGDERFATELLDHAESESVTFTEPGHYKYICSIHPYMEATITVYDDGATAQADGAAEAGEDGYVVNSGDPGIERRSDDRPGIQGDPALSAAPEAAAAIARAGGGASALGAVTAGSTGDATPTLASFFGGERRGGTKSSPASAGTPAGAAGTPAQIAGNGAQAQIGGNGAARAPIADEDAAKLDGILAETRPNATLEDLHQHLGDMREYLGMERRNGFAAIDMEDGLFCEL